MFQSFISKNHWTLKLLLLAFLGLLLLIPGKQIEDLVKERQFFQSQSAREVARGWAPSQQIGAPALTLFYTVPCKEKQCIQKVHLSPEQTLAGIKLDSIEKKRGIFSFPLYTADLNIDTRFSHQQLDELGIPLSSILWERSLLSIYIKEKSGLLQAPLLHFKGKDLTIKPSHNPDSPWSECFNTPLPLSPTSTTPSFSDWEQTFSLSMKTKGSESFYFIPSAGETQITMESDWPHPKFQGSTLPQNSTITPSGFSASWNSLGFQQNHDSHWSTQKTFPIYQSMGLSFIQPINHYTQTLRAVKYGILFIALTFLFCFLGETFSRKSIHPFQYLLIGVSLLLFFTLLLSISEHFSFPFAYFIAALAVTVKISVFVYLLLKKKKPALGAAAMLTLLYSFLYTLLQLEDMALLTGTLGLFVILAALMYLSVKIPWNSLPLKSGKSFLGGEESRLPEITGRKFSPADLK
jgi:inner membrane protein